MLQKFKDEELQLLLEGNRAQVEKEFARELEVSRKTISYRLRKLG